MDLNMSPDALSKTCLKSTKHNGLLNSIAF
jgi:hypothetical protein